MDENEDMTPEQLKEHLELHLEFHAAELVTRLVDSMTIYDVVAAETQRRLGRDQHSDDPDNDAEWFETEGKVYEYILERAKAQMINHSTELSWGTCAAPASLPN